MVLMAGIGGEEIGKGFDQDTRYTFKHFKQLKIFLYITEKNYTNHYILTTWKEIRINPY